MSYEPVLINASFKHTKNKCTADSIEQAAARALIKTGNVLQIMQIIF